MKKLINSTLLSLILLFLFSCAGETVKPQAKVADQELEHEYAYIKNSDFVPVPEVKYEEYQDLFPADLSENDSLTKESIARLPPQKLEQVAQTGDPISSAISLCYQRRFDQAFKIFDDIYSKYKAHPSYWNQMGSCYYLQNNLRKAILFYNKARDLNPRYAPAINNVGVIYLKQGKNQKSLVAFKRALEINGFAVTPLFNLAQLYLKYGFVDDALKMFTSLSKQKQGDPDVMAGLANSYLLKGDLNAALNNYAIIDQNFLSRPNIGLNYAVALKLAGKQAEAQQVFRRVNTSELGALRNYHRKVATYIGM